ncbi:MAG TPA: (2Fe-2S)-binding protein [Acidobacteriota bacterium]|nr:(2Fe-2S)-binding protein [Acidobacteriota bacterium]
MANETNDGKGKPAGRDDAKGGISRRNFLKDTGLIVGVPALGPIAVSQAASGAEHQVDRSTASAAPCPAGDSKIIALTVNGDSYQVAVEPHWTLRQLLRDNIGYTSPKDWCGGEGACGSCTVIMNGSPVLSCLTLACECDEAVVETAEGIANTKHPIIQAYIDNNAFQCGYCTPGFVCTAKALLDRNPTPTEADVRDALGGNLCRCGTYQQHPPAVLEAAEKLRQKS